MSLSKKHYIAISNIIRNNYDSTNNKGEYEPSINTKIISDLATYFRDENLKRLERVCTQRMERIVNTVHLGWYLVILYVTISHLYLWAVGLFPGIYK